MRPLLAAPMPAGLPVAALTLAALALATLALSACSTAPERNTPTEVDALLVRMLAGVNPQESDRIAAGLAQHPLGSLENPVRADMPPGQRAYLARLRCTDGHAPTFERQGSMGVGPYGAIIDGYQVVCSGSAPAYSTIYMDMYHRDHVETEAVPGFVITPP